MAEPPYSQGLGISLPNSPSRHPPSPLRHSTLGSPSKHADYPSPSSGKLQPKLRVRTEDIGRAAPPAFLLRPTHTKSGSGGGAGGGGGASLRTAGMGTKPMGPRRASAAQLKEAPSPRVDNHQPTPLQEHSQNPEPPAQAQQTHYLSPSRQPSVASNFTSSSRQSRQSRKMRSFEMGKKVSRHGSGGGKYAKLAGEEQEEKVGEENEAEAETITPRRLPPTQDLVEISSPPPNPRSPASTAHHFPPSHHSSQDTGETHYSFPAPTSFPTPPNHQPRTSTSAPNGLMPQDHFSPGPYPRFEHPPPPQEHMPRSQSQPMQLYSVPEFFDPTYTSRPRAFDDADFPPRRAPSNGQAYEGHSRSKSVEVGREFEDEELRLRPWSESTAPHGPQMLGRRGRSLSDGAELLARQGTLLHPASSNQRSSAELGVLLGGPRSRRLSRDKLLPPPPNETSTGTKKVKLEASKKGKARVEVDVVLERECVVEGGEVRGRMEVRVSREGLRVGSGKVRVVGFEEISPNNRHIFYHHPHDLPIFDPALQSELSSSLFASGPDTDGYHLAAQGTHSVPFRMRLPLGAGAKGTYTCPTGKGACVRYVVVGSIKIHIPQNGKRSIAHFYRPIVVMPYLNPAVVLAPSSSPIEMYVERGLGWSLKGERGRVELRVGLGRKIWVSGQRLWCEVGIRNDSNKKIKSMSLAILQDVKVFGLKSPNLMTKRKSLSSLNSDASVDSAGVITERRKVCEELTEADFTSHGAGRVTGKGWWTGVEPGESDHWDMSLQVPAGMLSIRRSRLVDVSYTLRVTLNNTIYVDVPIQLISFLSIDPPPMPNDEARPWAPMVPTVALAASDTRSPQFPQTEPQQAASPGALTSEYDHGPAARPSSTTLHVENFLQPPNAQARTLASPLEPHQPPPNRTQSPASSYTESRDHSRSQSALAPEPPVLPGLLNIPSSSRSDVNSFEGMDFEDEDDDGIGNTVTRATRRAQGRQMSLAVIQAEAEHEERLRAGQEEILQDEVMEEDFTEYSGSECTRELDYDDDRAPLPIVEEGESTVDLGAYTHDHQPAAPRQVESDEWDFGENEQAAETPRPQYEPESGHETLLEAMVDEDRQELEEVMSMSGHGERESHAWDYEDEMGSEGEEDGRGETPRPKEHSRSPNRFRLSAYKPSTPFEIDIPSDSDDSHPSAIFPAKPADEMPVKEELETTQVQEAVRRPIVRVPSQLISVGGDSRRPSLATSAGSDSRRPSLAKSPSTQSLRAKAGRGTLSERLENVVNKADIASSPRRASVMSRKESLTSLTGKPGPTSPAKEGPAAKVLQKKNSFSFATPGSPLRARVKVAPSPAVSPTKPLAKLPVTTSPVKAPVRLPSVSSPTKSSARLPSGTSPTKVSYMAKGMERGMSGTSIRSQSTISSQPPPLQSSMMSDSASSDGRYLESPPSDSAAAMGYQTFSPLISTAGSTHHEWGGMHELGSPFDSKSARVHQDSVMSRLSLSRPRSPHNLEPISIPYDDDASIRSRPMTPSTPSSCHSVLPSVKNKIAQLESRDEALRKFSVAGSAMLSPVGSPRKGVVDGARQRKSYTAALAPRGERSASEAYRNPLPRQVSGSTVRTTASTSSQYSYDYDPLYAPESCAYSTPTTPKRSSRLPESPSKVSLAGARLPASTTSSPASYRSAVYGAGAGADLSTYAAAAPAKLDPFGIGYSSAGIGLGSVEEDREREGLEREGSMRSTSTTATDVERAFRWRDYGGQREGESLESLR
ncbi:hypothetical protein B9479_007327 [Cryptococcus floricola]|uniref:Arrestin C-terminal-like domain-containing protein n=1 Tax=Cryptococcus floricola TaxID=2591691 RepID=A0A5D3APX4_9TREE|nr:hypothetical protein B9479_007327 [Cryptococcus floricola]